VNNGIIFGNIILSHYGLIILIKAMDILIIEDQKFFAENLCRYFQITTNFNVQYVTSAQKAFETLEKQEYQLIISDWHLSDSLPGKWFEKVGRRYPGQDVIIISSESISDNLTLDYNIDVIAYFEKPFDVAELVNFIVNYYSKEVMP